MAIPPALEPWVKLLRHPPGAFDPAAMTANAGAFNAQTLERFAWDYEILSQLEALAGEGVLTLYGGGCTMLHLDIADQRASVDLDLFCWVGSDQPSREAWDNCAAGLTARLGAINEKYFQLVEYVPKNPKTLMPMKAYELACPTATGLRLADGSVGCLIRVEVIFAPPPSRVVIPPRRVLPFPETLPHEGLPPEALIGSKLVALAVGELGVPPARLEELVKHVYDISKLQARAIASVDDLEEVRQAVRGVVVVENQWHRPRSNPVRCAVAANAILELFSSALLQQATRDFEGNYTRADAVAPDDWLVWPRLVRLLFSAVLGPHRNDYLASRQAVTGSLDLANLEADTRAKLEHALRSEFETHDRWRGSQSKGLPPAALFLDVVYGVGLNRATEVVRTVLGAEWSP